MNIFSKLMFLNPSGGDLGWGVKKVVAVNGVTWVLMNNNDLYGCGYNGYGQQGSGDTTNVKIFTKRASNVKDFACSHYTTWYITNDGDLYGCGANKYGSQGAGNTTDVKTFTKRASNVKDAICTDSTTWYIDNNGDLYGCGHNNRGQQGAGNTTDVKTFTKRASNVKKVVCRDEHGDYGGGHVIYLTTTGDLYGCGYGYYGTLGPNALNVSNPNFINIASNVSDVVTSEYATWYIDTNGDLYGAGYNTKGEQGNGNTSQVSTFTKRASNVTSVISIGYGYNTWYITNNGDLYGCGYNYNGQQGSGDTTDVKTFTKRASNVTSVFSSGGAIDAVTWYIDTNGDLYGCGYGVYYEFGTGSTSSLYTFTKLASNVLTFSCATKDGYAGARGGSWYIDTNGDLYGCGYNNYGQQGSGGTSNVTTFIKRTPKQPPSTIFNYGFRIDTQNSDPTSAITYIDDSENFTPASMDFTTGTLDYGSWENAFFQPRPVMLKYDGTVDYELDHNDFTKKLDGTTSDVSNTSYDGNCMIAFPQVWLKFRESNSADGSTNDSQGRYQFVNVANWNVDGSYHCYTHQNKNGIWLDEIFIMAFEPSNVSNKLRSLAGQTILRNLSGETMRQYAQSNGSAWDFMDFEEIKMLQMLCVLMFKSLDSQSKIGAGVVYSGNSDTTYATTGSTKDKGMFYAICNNPNSANATTAIKVFGIENLWGNRRKCFNGFVITSTSNGSQIKYKLCDYTTDGTTATAYSQTGTGYKVLASAPASNVTGYAQKMYLNSDGLFPYPDSAYIGSGSATTYYCDYQYLYKATTYDRFAVFGGSYSNFTYAGLFFVDTSNRLSSASYYYGASLSCKPL